MLGPFDYPPFTPWCQINPILTRPKKDSTSRRVIMDLSWPLPPGSSTSMGVHSRTLSLILVCPKRGDSHQPWTSPPSSEEQAEGPGSSVVMSPGHIDSSPWIRQTGLWCASSKEAGVSWMLACHSVSGGQLHHLRILPPSSLAT